MISKELLEKVLDFTSGNVFIKEIETRNNDIEYLCNVGGWNLLNIYELAHKCKEWAIKQGYSLCSCIHDDGSYERYYSICDILKPLYDSSCLFDTLLKTTEANTEPEAIFKACEYIMENKCGS